MPWWTSPLPVTESLNAHLQEAGLHRLPAEPEVRLPVNTIVVYASPDSVLSAALEFMETPPDLNHWLACYRQVQDLISEYPVIAAWRLEAMSPSAIARWLEGQPVASLQSKIPTPEPFPAMVASCLLAANPKLEEAYLDLEMNTELAGTEPDLEYWQRLRTAASDSQLMLEIWWRSHQQERDSRLEVERLRELHHEQAREIEALTCRLNELCLEREKLRQENNAIKQETAITKEHLYHTQEELENYFLKAQAGDKLALSMEAQLLRSQAVITRLIPQNHMKTAALLVDVDVLPPLTTEFPHDGTVQLEALLTSYAKSLQRAKAVLKRTLTQP